MENNELLLKILDKLGVTEQEFVDAAAEILNDAVNERLDSLVAEYKFIPEAPQEMNEAFRFFRQTVA